MLPAMTWLARGIILLSILAAVAAAADISGKWTFQVQTDGGTGSPTFVLKQDGEKLSGTYSGLFGQRQITGSVKQQEVTIEIKVDVQGQSATVVYTGRILSDTEMKGTVRLGDLGEGTWTGKKD
jgi:hypothetical protein